jgi:pimeloyl-ACP methyl ester carboxylesterase
MLETYFEAIRGRGKLRVARVGTGPAVVLLHGYPDNLQIWANLVPLLANRFEAFAFDWPGMGYSDSWRGGATPIHQADRVLELLDHWRVHRAHLVGLDMGGQPALVFAAKHQDRIASVTVMNSLIMWDADTSWELKVLRRFSWNRFFIGRFPRLVFRRAERTFLPGGVHLPAELRADLWEAFGRAEVRNFIIRMCAGYQGTLPRLPEIYRRIRCPTLLLWGQEDKHFPPVQAVRAHELISGSVLKILPGAKHWMPWHQADHLSQEISEFIELAASRADIRAQRLP